jgi:predicted CXXCH cytochrome family protein
MSLRSIFTRSLAALAAFACLLVAADLGLPSEAQSPIERLVSPGKLSNAHAKFEAECSTCHVSFNKGAQTAKCLDCHKETAADIRSKQGFHGRSPAVAGADCKACHAEHQGRGADIVKFDRKAFNHAFTDFPLLGGHQKVQCAECHREGVKFAAAATDCIGCHEADDPHFGRLGTACGSCHTPANWQTISFDHSTTKFALTGAHERQECASCHVDQTWKNLATDCASCHAKDDVHKGALGKDCASCHSAL